MFQVVLTDPSGRVVMQWGGFLSRAAAQAFIAGAPNQMAQSECCGHWAIESESEPESAPDDGYYCRRCGYYAAGYGGRDCPGCGSN